MMETVFISLRGGYTYVQKHPQLLMTILLIVLIPIAFIVSGQQFLEAGRENQERLEKDRIGILHDVFSSYIESVSFDTNAVQQEIEKIASSNPDIIKFVLAREVGDDILIVAAHSIADIGTEALDKTQFRMSAIQPGNAIITPYAQNGVRFWRSYSQLESNEGDVYYISTETSLEHIDTLFANRILDAYYWLLAIMLVILFLIVRHVRMIDYAYLYKQTKDANEMKDLFTNMIAHELRAPLTAMQGYASMIRQKENIPSDISTYATHIEDASHRLVVIVNDLLDIARIQSGKLSTQLEKADVQPIISSVLDAMRAYAAEKKIELKHEGVTTSLEAYVDAKRLHQALTNLVSNAIKYTPAGSITLEVNDLKTRVELRVKDTGMGISAENQKDMFTPFFRVKRDEVDAVVGTGLGMFITKQLIVLMKGSIAVESIKGVGTHVVITLPK